MVEKTLHDEALQAQTCSEIVDLAKVFREFGVVIKCRGGAEGTEDLLPRNFFISKVHDLITRGLLGTASQRGYQLVRQPQGYGISGSMKSSLERNSQAMRSQKGLDLARLAASLPLLTHPACGFSQPCYHDPWYFKAFPWITIVKYSTISIPHLVCRPVPIELSPTFECPFACG